MEPRRTRSSYLGPASRTRNKNTRMVKSTRVPSHELAKLKTSKPMLVIPQPVLRIHECLDDNVRMAQIESNAYVALGIKEEPIDEEYDDEGRYYEDADFTSYYATEDYFHHDAPTQEEAEEMGEMRTTRASKRRQLAGLENNNIEDDNNNSNNTSARKRSSRSKKTVESPQPEFRPIVLSVESLAPIQPVEALSDTLSVQVETSPSPTILQGNNNNEIIVPIEKSKSPNKGRTDEDKTKETAASPKNAELQKTPDESAIKENDARKTRLLKSPSKSPAKNSAKEDTGKMDTSISTTDECAEESIDQNSDGMGYDHETSSSESEAETEVFRKMWALSDEERKTITCSVCRKKFSRASILIAHKKKHFDTKTYYCDHCSKMFSSESSYKHHIAYSGLAPYKCDRCHKSYYTEQKAEAHRAQCQGKSTERKYHCEECGRSYVMLCSLRTHIRERHSDFKPVKNLCCELCGKRFRHKKYLELHMYSHSSEKKFECDVCHRKYKSSDILRHHVRMVHKNVPRVTCDVCQKEVSRVSLKAHLNRHREKREEEEQSARHILSLTLAADSNAPSCRVCSKYFENEKILEMHPCEGQGSSFPCPHCNVSFGTATELVGHTCDGLDNTKSRNTAKIYICVFCKREYNCHTPWLYHVRHHTNDKPYPCPDCDKSFRLKQGLKVHMRNHTGEKPFKCDQCPAAFKQKPFLLDHINTHTGNKPYQCQKCNARFSVRSALSTHKRIHRREEKRNSEAASSS